MSNKRNKNQRAKKAKQKKNRQIQRSVVSLAETVQLHRAGKVKEAEANYKRILTVDENDVSALNFYGMLLFQKGDESAGISSIEKAIDLDPDYSDALNNLGNMYRLQNRLSDAEEMYRKCVSANPDASEAYVNLGVLARARKQYAEAEEFYRKAIEITPELRIAHVNLGHFLESQGRAEEALEAYEVAESMRGVSDVDLYYRRANIYNRLGRITDSIDLYKEWLKDDPGNATATHMLAAITSEDTPDKPDPEYVKTLFDRFSSSFDEVLDNLDYRAPELVGELVQKLFPKQSGSLEILDAGCGTGLCGEYLSEMSKTLTGVDLSQGMLNKAAALNQYDALIEADLIDYLQSRDSTFNVIVSADTFCYFGLVNTLLIECASALLLDGYLVFTVEMTDVNTDAGYILNSHGRYSHSRTYLEKSIADANMSLSRVSEVVLRHERGEPVTGYLFVCQKTG